MRRSALAAVALLTAAAAPLGIGHVPAPDELAAWDIDARSDGAGLPPGRGSVAEGATIFASRCAACHGERGQGIPANGVDALAGGFGTLASAKPLRTVGSYWPHATTLFDYVRRAMPFDAPQTLTSDDAYAVSAFVLNLNGIVPAGAVLDAQSLPAIAMPNRFGFGPDPRPDVPPSPRSTGETP
jgi:cytochrome c